MFVLLILFFPRGICGVAAALAAGMSATIAPKASPRSSAASPPCRASASTSSPTGSPRSSGRTGPAGASSTFCPRLPAERGQDRLPGEDHRPRHHFAHRGIAKSFQITNLFPQLSVLENCSRRRANAHQLRHLDAARALAELTDKAEAARPGRAEHRRHGAVGVSAPHGDQRALGIAVALATVRNCSSSTSRPPA